MNDTNNTKKNNTNKNNKNNNTNKKIVLLGDSVLDNFFWLKMPKQDVRQQLENLINDASVVNLAVDESRIKDVMYGCFPKAQYVEARKRVFGSEYPYPTDKSGFVNPLHLLKKEKSSHAILSVGGNDGRVHLPKLMWSAESLIDALLNDGFESQYEELIKKTINIQPKLVIVLVYKPHEDIFKEFFSSVGWGLGYLPVDQMFGLSQRLDKVYDTISKIIFTTASKYNLPVIDLSTSFNPKDKTHYGSTPIEPSNKSGMTIARLIQHVVDNHDFTGNTRIYHAPNCGDIEQK